MAVLAECVEVDVQTFAGLPMPITLRLPDQLSDDELIVFSRNVRPYRVERNDLGELEIMSPLGLQGGEREAFVIRQLGNWAEERGGIYVSSQGGYKLGAYAVRSPDASWIAQSRVDALTDEERRRFPPLCPDFLIEILSESDSRAKLETKMEMWMENGARLAWMVDPFAATVSIYKPGESVEVLERPAWVEAGTVVGGFRLETARLWAK